MKKLKAWLPPFTYVPLLIVFIYNIVAYVPTKFLTAHAKQYDFSFGWDEALPFVPFFVLFYILAYAQWVWSYCYHCREREETCYHIATGDLIAKFICMLFFLFLPTEIVRPEITGNSIWDSLTGLIYWVDTPHNLFPSVHCLESWLCVRGALMMKKRSPVYIGGQLVMSLLVFASTVLIKQHFLVDILAGILVCEIGLFVSRRFALWSVFYKINAFFWSKIGKKEGLVTDWGLGD